MLRYVVHLPRGSGEPEHEFFAEAPVCVGDTIRVDGEIWVVTSVQPGDGTCEGVLTVEWAGRLGRCGRPRARRPHVYRME